MWQVKALFFRQKICRLVFWKTISSINAESCGLVHFLIQEKSATHCEVTHQMRLDTIYTLSFIRFWLSTFITSIRPSRSSLLTNLHTEVLGNNSLFRISLSNAAPCFSANNSSSCSSSRCKWGLSDNICLTAWFKREVWLDVEGRDEVEVDDDDVIDEVASKVGSLNLTGWVGLSYASVGAGWDLESDGMSDLNRETVRDEDSGILSFTWSLCRRKMRDKLLW